MSVFKDFPALKIWKKNQGLSRTRKPQETPGWKKIAQIGQYLAKIWTKYASLVFFGQPVYVHEPLLDFDDQLNS